MSEVTIADRQWELLMEVLWSINNGIAELNKNIAHMRPFSPAQLQMLKDKLRVADLPVYNMEFPGDFVEKPRERGDNAGQG